MLIFFTIVLTIYSLTNLYLFFKGYNALPVLKENKLIYSITFFVLAAVFVAAKFLEARHSSVFSDILNIAGGFWMAFMLYGFLLFILSDIIHLILKISGVLDPSGSALFRKWAFISTVSISGLLIIAGFITALIPVTTKYDITINKNAGELKTLKVAAVSDIHLGSVIRKRSMKILSGMLYDLKPDVVFLLGDIVDGEMGPVLRNDLLKYFACPTCTNGLYAITGNHEFIGGGDRTIPYIESKGIRVLKDEIVSLKGGVQVIGRIDRDSRRFYGKERLPLSELAAAVDTALPVILLDHQPFHLDESVKNGIDLQLSGHTHNGQMWPINLITKKIYELSYGYLKKGNTHFIVSSGFGLWGPRVRLGSRSEVLLITITFSEAGKI